MDRTKNKCEDCGEVIGNKGYELDCEGSSPICEDCCIKYDKKRKTKANLGDTKDET